MANIGELSGFTAGTVVDFKRKKIKEEKGYNVAVVIDVKLEKKPIMILVGDVIKVRNNINKLPQDIIFRMEKNKGKRVSIGKDASNNYHLTNMLELDLEL